VVPGYFLSGASMGALIVVEPQVALTEPRGETEATPNVQVTLPESPTVCCPSGVPDAPSAAFGAR
jgi:hypothetical protein